MIANHRQFCQVVKQQRRLERALAALRAKAMPANPRRFALLAEGPLDEIRKLQEEIDDYLTSRGVVIAVESFVQRNSDYAAKTRSVSVGDF